MAIGEVHSLQEGDHKSCVEHEAALAARRAWLCMMGLTDEEIADDIREHPLDLPEEIANLSAMKGVQKLNESSTGKK